MATYHSGQQCRIPATPPTRSCLRMGARRAHRVGRRGHDLARVTRPRAPRRRHRRRGPGAAGHAERAFARLPARDGGPRRVPRPSRPTTSGPGARRCTAWSPARARGHRGDRGAALHRDAQARLHHRGRIPLHAQRPRRQAVRGPRGAGATPWSARRSAAGIALTLLPVLYAHGGFGHKPLSPAQRRFGGDPRVRSSTLLRGCADLHLPAPLLRLGVAPHSVRAVDALLLTEMVDSAARAGSTPMPIHMHVSEQTGEVAECLQTHGVTPLAVDRRPGAARRALVLHPRDAPHRARDARPRATTGAAMGLCPMTEANLGDGIFDFVPWFEAARAVGHRRRQPRLGEPVRGAARARVQPAAAACACAWSPREEAAPDVAREPVERGGRRRRAGRRPAGGRDRARDCAPTSWCWTATKSISRSLRRAGDAGRGDVLRELQPRARRLRGRASPSSRHGRHPRRGRSRARLTARALRRLRAAP